MGTIERKEREKQQRKTDILEAAKKVFFAKGLTSATMDEIAAEAELSKGTLYLYFPSKEEMYLSLLGEGDAILKEMMQKALIPTLPATELLRIMTSTYYRFYKEYPEFFKIMFIFHHGELHGKVTQELYDSCLCDAKNIINMIEGVIQKGIGEGTFKQVDPRIVTLNLWATANGILFLYTAKEHEIFMEGLSEKVLLENALEIIIEGLKK